MVKVHDVIIIGGGQAGLSTAFYLRRNGLDPLILDNQSEPGGSWLHVWPSMTMFSTAEFSNLPGMPMPSYPGFPRAAHVIDYLSRYEDRYGFHVERPVQVSQVEYENGLFEVRAEEQLWRSRTLVAATGTWSSPFVPSYPGTFQGKQWHTVTYPGIEPFRETSVAVVGSANSGAQIAAELSDVAEVTWFVREQPRWMPDDVDGRELFRRNSLRALAIQRGEPDPGADSNLGNIVMLPHVLKARDAGKLQPTPMFTSLSELQADHLIWCTGFRPSLGPLRHVVENRVPKYPGLFLVGYGDWTGPGSATMTGVSPYARGVAKTIADQLGTQPVKR